MKYWHSLTASPDKRHRFQALFGGAIAVIGSLSLGLPTLAQAPTDTRADRAMFLIRSEAAVVLDTFPGNISMDEFGSRRDGNQILGYDAIVHRSDNDQIRLTCFVNLDETVICRPPSATTAESCGPERRQETLLERQFLSQGSDGAVDYAIRIYRSIDDNAGTSYPCINIYDVRLGQPIGTVPARASSSSSAYYSNAPLNGIDHQIIQTTDGRYIYRQSRGSSLLYEGYSSIN